MGINIHVDSELTVSRNSIYLGLEGGVLYPYFGVYVCTMRMLGPFGRMLRNEPVVSVAFLTGIQACMYKYVNTYIYM